MAVQVVVIGVSGSGKSTLAQALARHWSVSCIEGDELHAPGSLAKMAAGIPLNDDDRWPWLDRIGAAMVEAGSSGVVVACSALRLAYRDRLRRVVGPGLRFVFVDLPRNELEARMTTRPGHFMPASLLDSQLRTLERPVGESDVLTLKGLQSLEHLIRRVDSWSVAA